MKNVIGIVVLLTFVLGNKMAVAGETAPFIPLAPVTAQAAAQETKTSSNEQPTDTAPTKKKLTAKKTLKRTKGRRPGRRTSSSRRSIRPKAKVTFSV